ncbi:hypothetical protein INR49_031025, partial [Caranx melampygus]
MDCGIIDACCPSIITTTTTTTADTAGAKQTPDTHSYKPRNDSNQHLPGAERRYMQS